MKLSTLLLGAAAIGLLSTSVTFADDYLGGVVKSATVGGKEILTDAKGMTLYVWDKDEKGKASHCNDQCAVNWPPLLVDASTAVSGDWSLIKRDDGKMVVAYKGWPLYTWIKDKAPGDTTGDGVGGTWHTAVEGM